MFRLVIRLDLSAIDWRRISIDFVIACTKKGLSEEDCIDGCGTCRQARVICNGQRPCAYCLKSNQECGIALGYGSSAFLPVVPFHYVRKLFRTEIEGISTRVASSAQLILSMTAFVIVFSPTSSWLDSYGGHSLSFRYTFSSLLPPVEISSRSFTRLSILGLHSQSLQ